MSDDLIKREDAIKVIKDNSFAFCDDYLEINGYGAIDDIRALPSADRPQGEWIKDSLGTVICSECKRPRRDNRINHINFCNSCGAHMKGADDEV